MTTKTCLICMRGERFFDGFSHIDCPNGVTLTAQPAGKELKTVARGVDAQVIVTGGLRHLPHIQEQE